MIRSLNRAWEGYNADEEVRKLEKEEEEEERLKNEVMPLRSIASFGGLGTRCTPF